MGLISQEAGWALLIAAGVLGFLFVNPKSPVKKRLWVNPSLSIALDGDFGFVASTEGRSGTLRGYINLVSLKGEVVESIELKLGKKRLESDWKPRSLALSDCVEVNFFVPDWILVGRYICRLIALSEGGKSKSPKFPVELPVNKEHYERQG